jgi:acyl carrier protein phosphodiesterase
MNFLAHIYLSGTNEQVLLGNFIGDWIKGSDYKKYPADIQKGMILHRTIDFYTDSHLIVRSSKSRLNTDYHKYSGIIIDIFYDHFLASDWHLYSKIQLPEFCENVNKILMSQMHFLPRNMQEFVPGFMNSRWLESYASTRGIEQVLKGMVKNTSLPDKTDYAMDILIKYYDDFRDEFYKYFPQLVKHIENTFQISPAKT